MEINKIEAFDYMLHLFEEWRDNHETIKGKPFPKLTAMKLLFLAAAPKKDGGDDLLDIFDNFYAVPYGPVESDVYNAMCEDKLPSFSVKYRSIEPREGAEPYNAKRYNDKFYHRVRNAVNDLREKNEKLVLLNAFELAFYDNFSRDCKLNGYINPYPTYSCLINEMFVEIKQNKENMEEKKLNLKEFNLDKRRKKGEDYLL